jgi:hypothetical protein
MSRRGRRSLPTILQRRHTDEFEPPPYDRHELAAAYRTLARSDEDARHVGLQEPAYARSRRGTAAGLRALNEEYGERFYEVPPEAALDEAAAQECFAGEGSVIDVQTHFMADRPELRAMTTRLLDLYRSVAPDWWRGLEGVTAYNMAEYLRCVFLETENSVAVLTSGPGLDGNRMLFNPELNAVRELVDRLGPTGRLLQHAVVHPEVPAELERMADYAGGIGHAGWKVYTLGEQQPDGSWRNDWMLDDEAVGQPFLERARALGPRLVCTHKGISSLAPAGSPRDIGPAARAFPELDFLVYHSGYEMPRKGVPLEGPYTEDTLDIGVNRLVRTVEEARLGPGGNVHAELGTTWFCLIRRPVEAAHVLGKLLRALGDDNIVWGTDSIWYGPAQPLIDAFRAFQIPEAMREEFGYPELTPESKEKILSRNGARLYGIDLERAREMGEQDDLSWMGEALEEAKRLGVAGALGPDPETN